MQANILPFYTPSAPGWGQKVQSFFMPLKELWEAYSNRTVRPSVLELDF